MGPILILINTLMLVVFNIKFEGSPAAVCSYLRYILVRLTDWHESVKKTRRIKKQRAEAEGLMRQRSWERYQQQQQQEEREEQQRQKRQQEQVHHNHIAGNEPLMNRKQRQQQQRRQQQQQQAEEQQRQQGGSYFSLQMGDFVFTFGPFKGVTAEQFEEAINAASHRFSALHDEEAFLKAVPEALAAILARDLEARRARGQKRKAQEGTNRQEQQRRQEQQQQQHQMAEQKRQDWAAAAAAQPQLNSLSFKELKDLIQQAQVELPAGVIDKQQLLELAKRSLQVWECRRLILCAKLAQQDPSKKLHAALCVFRIEFSPAAGPQDAAAAARCARAGLRATRKRLALLVHPDKAPAPGELAGCELLLFEEAFKALTNAYELVSKEAAL